eukprot:gene33825-43708_t
MMLANRFRATSSSLRPLLTLQLPRRNLFIDAEATPNPHSYKFKPGREVLNEEFGTGMYFQAGEKDSYQQIAKSPLAKELFTIEGVKSVFFGKDFITITKASDSSWAPLKPAIFSSILDFFAEDKPVMLPSTGELSDTAILDTDDEVVATIKELMETRIRPSVQEDGGDIFYVGFDPTTGLVKVRLAGSCVGCPSSSVTLRNGVENMLMHYIPEVKGIEEVVIDASE